MQNNQIVMSMSIAKRIYIFLLIVGYCSGCTTLTEMYAPIFQEASSVEIIPAEGARISVPFVWEMHTKMSRPHEYRDFKCLMTLGTEVFEYSSEEVLSHPLIVYDSDGFPTYSHSSHDGSYWEDYLLYFTIPENNSGEIRGIIIQVSVDELYSNHGDNHIPQWGGWQTIYTGQQACFD